MKLLRRLGRLAIISAALVLVAEPTFAMDSYRYLHVTIETPWTIFLFLLVAVLSPFILMAVLVWRFAERRVEPGEKPETVAERAEP